MLRLYTVKIVKVESTKLTARARMSKMLHERGMNPTLQADRFLKLCW